MTISTKRNYARAAALTAPYQHGDPATDAAHKEHSHSCGACAAMQAAAELGRTLPRATLKPGTEMAEVYGRGRFHVPEPAPPRRKQEGEGPYRRLVLRGATLIDGTGAPPMGPVDIVIEGGRITQVCSVGVPKMPIAPERRPAPGDREIDCTGAYVLPGFIDSHSHISFPRRKSHGVPQPAEYVYKLWLAHGITSVRETGSINGLEWTLSERDRSAAHEIVAPHIHPYVLFPLKDIYEVAAKDAPAWVRAVKEMGAEGIKYLNATPETMATVLAEAKRVGLPTACHHSQLSVNRMNALQSARLGLTSIEHWYGLPEALFESRTIQDYPAGYNYNDEQHRFGEAGKLWCQAAEPGSVKWRAVIDELISLDTTLVPTFSVYEAMRDEMRARRADWLDEYTWPSMKKFFQPHRESLGSAFFDWTTADEIAWKENFRRWMSFVRDFVHQGGRLCAGSDAGFMYSIYGFAFIRELELLQEAGLNPLEIIRIATLNGARLLGRASETGSVEPGKKADLLITFENPLNNFKTLYGSGAMRLNDELGRQERVQGLRWTIKDGIVFDVVRLLAEIRDMCVAASS